MHPCFQGWISSAWLLYIIGPSLNLDWLRLNERSMWRAFPTISQTVQVFYLIWTAGILTIPSSLPLCISCLLVASVCCPCSPYLTFLLLFQRLVIIPSVLMFSLACLNFCPGLLRLFSSPLPFFVFPHLPPSLHPPTLSPLHFSLSLSVSTSVIHQCEQQYRLISL